MEHRYFGAIDGVRALAVLSVMLFHLEPTLLPGGFTGVDIFFVISGYVVARSLVNHSHSHFFAYIVAFYQRRILRLFPALLVCLFITSAIVVLFIPQAWLSQSIAETGLAAFLGWSNIALAGNSETYFSPSVEFNPFVHTWSLGVEEQFYVIFPVLFYFYLKGKSRLTLAGLAVISFILSVKHSSSDANAAYYLLTSRFWELAAGALLCQWHGSQRFRYGGHGNIAAALGLMLVVTGFVFASKTAFPFPWALLPVTGTLLLIHHITCAKSATFTSQLFAISGVRYVGKLSYSLYLWHWPVYTFFRWSIGLQTPLEWSVAVFITFIMALISYHLVEQRLGKLSSITATSAGRTVGYGMITILVSYGTATYAFDHQKLLSQSVTNNRYVWYPYYSHSSHLESGNSLSNRTIYVIGDSHAGAYGTMLRMLADETGIKTQIHSQGGCGAVNMREPVLTQDSRCADKLEQWLQSIEQHASPDDIIFFATLKAYRLTNQYRMYPRSKTELLAQVESEAARHNRQAAYTESVVIIERMNNITPNIITDAPKPVFSYIPFRCSDWFNHTNPTCKGGPWQNRQYMETLRQPVMESLHKVKRTVPNLHIWDPLLQLCDKQRCPVYDGNKTRYFDGDHLSAHGNRLLYPSFRKAVLSLIEPTQAAGAAR
ncbi:acyltransferase family protein [Salinimonas chungwhensis]|uniref:acyltransferase family protein n=1 Tax=Salinimonas chungwhensis TaxID=265425 RepID=UPI00037AAF5E|nr:acyltransferase family protein [Salinimonas chungwhensis]